MLNTLSGHGTKGLIVQLKKPVSFVSITAHKIGHHKGFITRAWQE